MNIAERIEEKLITVNGFSRSGKKRGKTLAIILHNVGKDDQRAESVWNYFESLKTQDAMDKIPDVSASAHYIIDQDGSIIRAIPEDEKAYHCGSSQKDPVSGFIYTEAARILFGKYAAYPELNSPNTVTIGIEMCHGKGGVFTPETIAAATELCADLCRRYSLDPTKNILTHNEVVGWKPCPLLWTNKPALLVDFKSDVVKAL